MVREVERRLSAEASLAGGARRITLGEPEEAPEGWGDPARQTAQAGQSVQAGRRVKRDSRGVPPRRLGVGETYK